MVVINLSKIVFTDDAISDLGVKQAVAVTIDSYALALNMGVIMCFLLCHLNHPLCCDRFGRC